jgi:hypothetical protein
MLLDAMRCTLMSDECELKFAFVLAKISVDALFRFFFCFVFSPPVLFSSSPPESRPCCSFGEARTLPSYAAPAWCGDLF